MQAVKKILLPALLFGAVGAALCAAGAGILGWLRLWWRGLPGWLFWPLWLLPPVCFVAGFRIPRGRLKSAFRRLGEGWFGLCVYPLLFALLAELARLLAGLLGAVLPLRETGWVVLAFCGAAFAVGVPKALRPQLTRYTLAVPGLKRPLRLALLADLHLGVFTGPRLMRRVAALCNTLEPDAVLLAGDVFDEEFSALRHPERSAAALAGLQSRLGSFSCEGNHDLYCPGPEQLRFLRAARIRRLRDELVRLPEFTLCGRKNSRNDTGRLPADALLQKAERSPRPVIVLDHDPKEYEALLDAGAALVLCGHTHGGQTFPGNLLLKLLPDHGYGLKRRGTGCCIVTSGAGLWGLPVKLGVKTEVVCIDLRPEGT